MGHSIGYIYSCYLTRYIQGIQGVFYKHDRILQEISVRCAHKHKFLGSS